jgi:two-component sensor histidine kinase
MPFKSFLKCWLLSFLGWGLFAAAIAGQITLVTTIPWTRAFGFVAKDWLPWAVLTPIIFAFCRRFPIERETARWAVPAHLVACAAAVAFSGWMIEWANPFMFGSDKSGTHQRGPREGAPPPPDGPRDDGQPRRGPDGPPPFPGRGGIFRRAGFHFPIYWLIASAAHALVFYRRSQERERRALALSASLSRARLEALKMQLQPHFLFNALNAIAALVHSDPEAADEMLAALSDFLRLTLESVGEQEVPLRRELEFVERYLAIEQVRFGDRLRVTFDIPPETASALVPALILQPLVENAVRHGLEPRPGPGRIEIRAWIENGELYLAVRDDGPGLPVGTPLREGVGLANTRARLRELHGPAGRLDLRDARDGLLVVVALPYVPAA